ncbi:MULTISPECIES: FAD-dependent monooxygenase [unclassified Nocardia]|uniref:FAD-dependent monooxygenase n=1 Tax=unclassified Nocardia TaxID=2637762 RepID=UPI0035DD8F65
MKLHTVAVLGGGPGGLYTARLIKKSHPDAQVDVYEQGTPDTTFGFGVGLAARTQDNLRQADSASFDAIEAACHPHEMSMSVGDRTVVYPHGNLVAIARTRLLQVLQDAASAAGVGLHFGTRRTAAEFDVDLVIAADGVNSATRQSQAAVVQPHISVGKGLYLWCGTEFALPRAVFVPVTTEHGTFVAHAYPYAPDRSTFLIETDEQTWRNAGFDRTTMKTEAGESDEESLRYLEKVFADSLDGHQLIGNRTRWTHFHTVSCERWHTGNTVLLGDAAHTAHYSIGSGTKLAMEDAIALDNALRESDDLASALERYELERRPAVEHLQSVARRSELWWESFPGRTDLPLEQLTLAYMTRAGKVGIDRFAHSAPALARAGLAAYAGTEIGEVPADGLDDWILARPLTRGGRTFGDRIAPPELRHAAGTHTASIDFPDAWGAAADAFLDELPVAQTIWLTGPADRSAVLTRLDLAERCSRRTTALIVVEATRAQLSDLAAGLASARTHLVAITDEPNAVRRDAVA